MRKRLKKKKYKSVNVFNVARNGEVINVYSILVPKADAINISGINYNAADNTFWIIK